MGRTPVLRQFPVSKRFWERNPWVSRVVYVSVTSRIALYCQAVIWINPTTNERLVSAGLFSNTGRWEDVVGSLISNVGYSSVKLWPLQWFRREKWHRYLLRITGVFRLLYIRLRCSRALWRRDKGFLLCCVKSEKSIYLFLVLFLTEQIINCDQWELIEITGSRQHLHVFSPRRLRDHHPTLSRSQPYSWVTISGNEQGTGVCYSVTTWSLVQVLPYLCL
jgi:hypothetical protein